MLFGGSYGYESNNNCRTCWRGLWIFYSAYCLHTGMNHQRKNFIFQVNFCSAFDFFKTEYSVNVNYDSDENKNKQESNIEHESVNMKIEKVSKNTRLMQNNWNTKMIQGLYPFHEISADILRDSWKKSATACQYRSRCPLDEGFNSDRLHTTDEEALLGKMNNYRAIFWCTLLGLNNVFGEYIFMDL